MGTPMVAASSGSPIFLFILLGFLAFYWFILRPGKKRQNQQQQMLNELNEGDEVLTAGGIYGTISRIDDDEVVVEIAPQLEVRVARRAIAAVTPEPEPEDEEADEAEEPDEPEEEAEEPEEQPEEAAASSEPGVDTTGPITGREPSGGEDRG